MSTMQATLSTRTVRYRALNPRGYYTVPVATLSAARLSPALGLAALLLIGSVVAVLSRIGADLTPEGVVVRRGSARPLLRWTDVSAVGVVHDRYHGDRIQLTKLTGERVVLPAPMSSLPGYAEGLARVRAEVARAQRP
jgi:hypothetical protein